MNGPQQIFLVFYAIFWGTAANAQPRWRAFAWGQVFGDSFTWKRILLSFFLLNLIPVVFFVYLLWLLSGTFWTGDPSVNWIGTARILGAVAPGFATFGFYRIWMAVVQWLPTVFYGPKERWESNEWKDNHPGLCPSRDFIKAQASPDLFFGIVYVVVGVLVPIAICHCLS
jgi:hypothetical protein